MADSNRWANNQALCPKCRKAFAELREDGVVRVINAPLVLIRIVTFQCGQEDCGYEFTYRPKQSFKDRFALPRPFSTLKES